jgi:hypothetical protein
MKMSFLLLALLFTAGAAPAAVPVITAWSSTGGSCQNKDNDQDAMFLAQQGDHLVFSVTADQPVRYEWAVNKSTAAGRVVTVAAASDSFNWTVPSGKGIWEIHLRVWNGSSEEAHREWVVSTLAAGEAPDVFDCFSDLKYAGRSATDPWGRQLPVWTVESGAWNAAQGCMRPAALGYADHTNFSTPTDILRGTWIFRYRYANGTPVFSGNNYVLELTAQYNNPAGIGTGIDAVYQGLALKNPVDGHWWFDYPLDGKLFRNGYIVNMAGSQIDKALVGGSKWHEVVFVRDENDYIHSWLDGNYVCWSTDKVSGINDSTKFFFNLYDGAYALTYPIVIDGIEVYRDRYLAPVSSITYDAGSDFILLKGWGVTPAKIAAALNDPSLFAYDPATNTGTAYKDLVVLRGSELLLENGTLVMASAFEGERKIKCCTDSICNIVNSTITSSSGYSYLFQNVDDGDSSLKNTFRVTGSVIDRCGGLFLERPVKLWIENSSFTHLAGDITVYFRWPIRDFTVKNSRFSGNTGNEGFILNGGDQFNELTPKPAGLDIVDCDLSGISFQAYRDGTYYLSPGTPPCTINLINSKLGSHSAVTLRPKYYLDVKVVDAGLHPVQDAAVSVQNEQNDSLYPAENLVRGKKDFQLSAQLTPGGDPYFDGQTTNWVRGWADVNDHSSAVTGADGHTPGVADAANTLVLTGRELNEGATSCFTYRVTASKNGLQSSFSGLSLDAAWLRDDPGTPSKTLVLVLGQDAYVSSGTDHPALAFVEPADGATVMGLVPVEITVSGASSVQKVEIYIDDILSKTLFSAPYTWDWDTAPVTEGEHRITACVYSAGGNQAQSTITVRVIRRSAREVVYPNPYIKNKSAGHSVRFANLPKESTLRIYTISGDLVQCIRHPLATDGGNEDWDITDVASGVYVYTVISAAGTSRGKTAVIK